jgi:hypothetical protein
VRKKVIVASSLLALICGCHFYALDGLNGLIWRMGLGEDTVYGAGYTEGAFQRVRLTPFVSRQHVLEVLGAPLGEVWNYGTDRVIFRSGKIETIYGPGAKVSRLSRGMGRDAVLAAVGTPSSESWIYSRSQHDSNYRVRIVVLKKDRVSRTIHQFFVD